MQVTVYHNPRCSKSRATLKLLEQRGIEPVVIEYLQDPPDARTIARLAGKLGVSVRELVRRDEPAWKELGVDPDQADDALLLETLTRHPILIQRPIVVAGERARIGRPPEAVCEIL